jgi:hypothetical protein
VTRSLLRAGVLAIAAFAALGSPSGPSNPPDPDVCADPPAPGGGAITAVDIGRADDSAFVPLTDGEMVTLAIGGQGFSMLPVRLRFRGAAPPACVAQATTVKVGAEVIATESRPIATEVDGDGRATAPIYLILDRVPGPSETVSVSTTAAGQTDAVSITVK